MALAVDNHRPAVYSTLVFDARYTTFMNGEVIWGAREPVGGANRSTNTSPSPLRARRTRRLAGCQRRLGSAARERPNDEGIRQARSDRARCQVRTGVDGGRCRGLLGEKRSRRHALAGGTPAGGPAPASASSAAQGRRAGRIVIVRAGWVWWCGGGGMNVIGVS